MQCEEALPGGGEKVKAVYLRRFFCTLLACALLTCAACAKVVVPGGHTVGVALKTGGAVVIGTADVGSSPSPARLAGLKGGDVIVSVDGVRPNDAAQLTGLLHEGQCRVSYMRNGKTHDAMITPVYSEGAYRLGAWVRDGAAGIGTLTFYDPETGELGALGHPVTDADAGIVLPVTEGTIYQNVIVGIDKGKRGSPGEMLGQFYDGEKLGSVDLNGASGVFGKVETIPENALYPAGIETADPEEVHTGKAELLCTVDGEGIKKFSCEIVDIDRRMSDTNRAFTIRITDEKLISATGGIVQGMSGSPIIQDCKLVGAVTHVLVNDPTRGYGIFIENMLEAAG